MRRVGTIATLAAGVGLLGASLHGMTNVDHTLKIAAATPPAPQIDVVRETEVAARLRPRRTTGSAHRPEV